MKNLFEQLRAWALQIAPLHLFFALSAGSIAVMIVGTCSLYEISGALPPPRELPPLPEKSAVLSYRFKEGYYRSLVEEDAKKVGLKAFDYRILKQGNAYLAEFTGDQLLRSGAKLETNHLRLKLLKKKIWVGESGQGYRTNHLILGISNLTHHYLAYQVRTQVSGNCGSKGIISHNAIALAPHQTINRTECILQNAGSLHVKRVEVMEVTPLGYFYISKIDPLQLQYNPRTAEGHQGAGLPPCKLLPWRAIRMAIERGEGRWYDVIDFYSRHNCDEYSFFDEYRWRKEGPKNLPVKPPAEK